MEIKRPSSTQPIPKHAQRVFKGVIFDVYQWKQELFDGSTATFEKIKRVDTVNVIPVTNEGKLMLSQQKQPGTKPFIGVLGGRIDDNETPLEAAKRELLEEAGLSADKLELWFSNQILEKIDWAIFTFVAKGLRKTKSTAHDAGEDIKLIEVTFDEFINLTAQENYRDTEIALKVYKAQHNKKVDTIRQMFSPQ